jgi:hypothetical protein
VDRTGEYGKELPDYSRWRGVVVESEEATATVFLLVFAFLALAFLGDQVLRSKRGWPAAAILRIRITIPTEKKNEPALASTLTRNRGFAYFG